MLRHHSRDSVSDLRRDEAARRQQEVLGQRFDQRAVQNDATDFDLHAAGTGDCEEVRTIDGEFGTRNKLQWRDTGDARSRQGAPVGAGFTATGGQEQQEYSNERDLQATQLLPPSS